MPLSSGRVPAKLLDGSDSERQPKGLHSGGALDAFTPNHDSTGADVFHPLLFAQSPPPVDAYRLSRKSFCGNSSSVDPSDVCTSGAVTLNSSQVPSPWTTADAQAPPYATQPDQQSSHVPFEKVVR